MYLNQRILMNGDTVDTSSLTQQHRGWTLLVTSLSVFMLLLDINVVNVALPEIRKELDASFTQLQWVLDAYALGLAAILVAAGSLADRIGRRRIFTIGFVIFTLASLACGLAWNVNVLIVSRFIQGIGGAILFAVGPALLGYVYTGADRTRAFGIFGGVGGLAIAAGPLVGGGLTDGLDWRWIFLINIPLGIIALIITRIRVTESRSAVTPPLDLMGAALFSTFLTLLVLGLLRGEDNGWTSTFILGLFAASAITLIAFIVLQVRRGDKAMFEASLFTNTTFNGLNIATLFLNIALLAAIFLLITYIQVLMGYSAWASGLRALPLTLTLVVGAFISGTISSRTAPRISAALALGCVAIGLLLIRLVDSGDSWTAALPMMFVLGIGMGLFNPIRTELSVSTVSPERAGVASGINATFQQVGAAIGVAGLGAFFQNRVHHYFENDPATSILGPMRADAARGAATGGGNALRELLPPEIPAMMQQQLSSAADAAFINSLHTTFTVAALFPLAGMIIALFTIRRKDFWHAGQSSGIDKIVGVDDN